MLRQGQWRPVSHPRLWLLITGFPCLVATELPVSCERERARANEQGQPHPSQGDPRISWHSCPSPPASHRPCPFLAPPGSQPVPGVPGQEGSPVLCPELQKEQSLTTPTCDSSSGRPWRVHIPVWREGNQGSDRIAPPARGCPANKGQSCVLPGAGLGRAAAAPGFAPTAVSWLAPLWQCSEFGGKGRGGEPHHC